jgi:hypothetical protein
MERFVVTRIRRDLWFVSHQAFNYPHLRSERRFSLQGGTRA